MFRRGIGTTEGRSEIASRDEPLEFSLQAVAGELFNPEPAATAYRSQRRQCCALYAAVAAGSGLNDGRQAEA
jgi:hypothetical protein